MNKVKTITIFAAVILCIAAVGYILSCEHIMIVSSESDLKIETHYDENNNASYYLTSNVFNKKINHSTYIKIQELLKQNSSWKIRLSKGIFDSSYRFKNYVKNNESISFQKEEKEEELDISSYKYLN